MSIRTVKCPRCGTGANVPAGMANVKCGSCGSIWNVNNPGSASETSPAAKRDAGSKNSSGGSASKQQTTLIVGIAGVLAVLATIGIAVAFFVNGSTQPAAEMPVTPPPPAPVPTIAMAPTDATPTYREVDLPESTRQEIYFDYRKLVESSTEKKIMILKDSPVNKSLQSMLGKTVDREITHFSLIHKITEEDVRQIIAEGDAKKWPGSRPPETESADAK